MVFESVISLLLNKYLGEYIDNLDKNQLNIGLLGGDIKLTNLVLKQSALDELDLPIQTVYGRIGKLVLKIPFTKLYSAPIIINIEDIYLVAEPNLQVVYNPEKEDKRIFEAKQKEIQKVEEAKKAAAEKDAPKADYSYVEKLVTQIVKNVQINIKNIHIRYEDKVTRPGFPFALGVTLSELNCHSTNEKWEPAIMKEDITKSFKSVQLKCLAFYWNSGDVMYGNLNKPELLEKMLSGIACTAEEPTNYYYVLGPINSSCRLKLNQKPELDIVPYSEPKVLLNLEMDKLSIGISKNQYRDIIALAESMERMTKGIPFRKFRPNVPSYKGHYKLWWKFAFNCVMEAEIVRNRDNWNWNHMLEHRNMCRDYGELYKKKLKNLAKPSDLDRIKECEMKLDLVNIVIIRQRIEMETERLNKTLKTAEKKSWFGWMWGKSTTSEEQGEISSSTDILKQFQAAMTPEEKQRLYNAIDYQENAAPAIYPETYVDNLCKFALDGLHIELRDDDAVTKRILLTELTGVKCMLSTRPSSKGLTVNMKIDDFCTTGLQQDDFLPKLIVSDKGKEGTVLLQVLFELNPLGGEYDQRIHVNAQPLTIVYDAKTINKIIDVFKIPDTSSLEQLSAAASNKLLDLKERSVSGLQYAIDKHVHLDLKVDFKAPIVIIPYGGKYCGPVNVLVANLGYLQVYSIDRPKDTNLKALHAGGASPDEIVKILKQQSYDQFNLKLTNLQVLAAQSDEDWLSCISESSNCDMHILKPMSFNITLFKCLLTDDPRLPLNKIKGELPSIDINISEARLMLLMSLATSIPLPESEPEMQPLLKSKPFSSSMMLATKATEIPNRMINPRAVEEDKDLIQFTTVEVKFVMSEFSVTINQQETLASQVNQLLVFKVKSLICTLHQQTYNTNVSITLNSINVQQNYGNQIIDVMHSPLHMVENLDDSYLFKVNFIQVQKHSPELHTIYKSCETSLALDFGCLSVTLHREALLELMKFARDIQEQIQVSMERENLSRTVSAGSTGVKRRLSTISTGLTKRPPTGLKKKMQAKVVESILFKLEANLNDFTVNFATQFENLSKCAIRGLNCEIIVKTTYTQITTKLQEIIVNDLNPDTNHKKILSATGQETLNAQIVMNNLEADDVDKPDMIINVAFGGLRIIFLNRFVTRMLNFLNKFQEAQNTIAEVSKVAAQQAKENMKSAYVKATKIVLNISLKAPDIIIPVNSNSFDALICDLGLIQIQNRFIHLNIVNEIGHSAVVDELRMNLTKLKISTVKLNEDYSLKVESLLLNPIDFKFTVKRNLSSSWYQAIPDVDISVKINKIAMSLSKNEYSLMMKILNENIAEAEGVQEETRVRPVETKRATMSSVAQMTTVLEVNETAKDEASDQKVHILLKFTFALDSLVVNLYTGSYEDIMGESVAHNPKLGLGCFSLEGISLKGRILSDNSIVSSFLLVNCLLQDTRIGREDKLNTLIHRTIDLDDNQVSTEIAPNRSMLDVTFQQKAKDMFADVRIISFTFIISMEYIMKIAEFFSVPAKNVPVKPPPPPPSSVQTRSSIFPADIEPPKQMQMTINLKLEKPDIILVENMDHLDTKALILNSEILLKYRMIGSHQVLSGTIKDLSLYSSLYSRSKTFSSKYNILHPVTISLAGSTPEDKGLHLELIITDVILSLSPSTIELANRILAKSLSSSPALEAQINEAGIHHDELWAMKKFKDTDFWFLRTDIGIDAVETSFAEPSPTKRALQELCIVSIPSIVLSVESGIGNKTVPMLLLESTFKGSVRNWSSQLNVDASLTLEMGYYNSALAMWEPIIEPVEIINNGNSTYVPWELKLEVSMNEPEEMGSMLSPSNSDVPDMSELQIQPPVMTIDLKSENRMELTVTKRCIDVLKNLGKGFATAMKDTEDLPKLEALSPYRLENELGIPITLMVSQGTFNVFNNPDAVEVVLDAGASVNLQVKEELSSKVTNLTRELTKNSNSTDQFIHVKVKDVSNTELALPVSRADKRYFALNYRGESKDNWGLISDIRLENGETVITLRSILKIFNHFKTPMDVYYMTKEGNKAELISTVQPGNSMNVPLNVVYASLSEIFFSPPNYAISNTPLVWKDLQKNPFLSKTLSCAPLKSEQGTQSFFIKLIGEMEQIYYETSTKLTMASTCYNVHLRPNITFQNALPMKVVFCLEDVSEEFEVGPGETLELPYIEAGKSAAVIRLPDYLEKRWSSRNVIEEHYQEFAVWSFNSYDSAVKMSLELGVHTVSKNGSKVMILYCPFWMLNKTGLTLGYRQSDDNLNVLHHPPHFKGPILFSFNAKNFFGKKKASVRVDQGNWSDKFSLDVAGSSGVVVCRANDTIYKIGVHNQLTYNGLTKQVTFTPYYIIINNAPYKIECQESDRPADHWVQVEPNSCAELWPKSELEDKLLRIRISGTSEVSAPFLYTESHTTLLKLDNRFGGINVDIQLTEGAVYINLVPYQVGMAPALVLNCTRDTMSFWEKDTVQMKKLPPKHMMLLTWDNPSGPRVLMWDKGNKKEAETNLCKDIIGEYEIRKDYTVYWSSFLDGMQRILLFTENKDIAEGTQSANLFEIIQQEINVSLFGFGLSLVNNNARQEILYVGIASSGVIWEACKHNSQRFKPLSTKESAALENAYKVYQSKLASGEDCEGPMSYDKLEVDFKLDLMYRPNKRKIRRSFQTGVWLQMRTNPNQMQLHAKINRIQIDNQMYDNIFPIVLAPVAPPKSVAIESGVKPFIEVSIVQLLMKNSQIKQYKYFKVLVQEFHVKVDLGLINALVDLAESEEQSEEDIKILFQTDMELVNEPLYAHASSLSMQEQKSFYDLLHLSPLKIHLSFSMSAGTSTSTNSSTPNFVNVLLQSLGVTLTDLQDVVFKLAYFEREYTFLTQRDLINEAKRHYVGQSVKQLYVLVLGLDVLGNPYGLVVGISKGVEDLFYEPFQGAIQGPGEFAEGVVLGVKSLFGHTVGGAAGAVSRITGAMGKGVAALTFDKDYQRKRRDMFKKKPTSAQEGFARSSKGLVMGVVDGVTGVFTKPISGAKEEGVEGFFKGLGKGALGLVARPTAGVIDFASGSLDVVKRATEIGEDTMKLRHPRFLPADSLVRPYNIQDATGNKLLIDLEKGKYADTDIYVKHYIIIEKKEILMLTNKRIAYMSHNDLFGGWQTEWTYTWQDLNTPAKIVPKGIYITTSGSKKLFGSNDSSKTILIANSSLKEEILQQIEYFRGS